MNNKEIIKAELLSALPMRGLTYEIEVFSKKTGYALWEALNAWLELLREGKVIIEKQSSNPRESFYRKATE